MRLRKESDEMLEEEILLIAKVSDALAHPARVKIFRYIMQANRAMVLVCNKLISGILKSYLLFATRILLKTSITHRQPFLNMSKSLLTAV